MSDLVLRYGFVRDSYSFFYPFKEDFMADVKQNRLTGKEVVMLSSAVDLRISQLKRAANNESNIEVRKLRELDIREHENLKSRINGVGVQVVIE